MTAYRAGPAVPGLPFPRKSLGLYTAILIVVAVLIFFLPLSFFANASGWRMFKEGGVFYMGLIFSTAIASAGAIGALGAFAIRGKRVPMMIVALVPVVPLLAGVLGTLMGLRMTFWAISGESVDPDQKFRIAAEGMAEAHTCLVFGCFVGAASCGAASVALLGATASVDRAHANAPVSKTWIGSMIAGIVGVLVMLVMRFSQKALLGLVLVILPSMILISVLAMLAARNGALARGWHDKQEANAWISSLLAAAILASAGIVLLDVGGAYFGDRLALGAVSGESVDPSQRARILVEGVREGRSARLYAIVNGLFTFATVAIGIVGALGKGPDGSSRSPLAAPPFAALGGLLVFLVAVLGVRSWAWSSIEKMATYRDETKSKIDLPHVRDTYGFSSGNDGPELLVTADGSTPEKITYLGPRNTVVVVADRRATWGMVSKEIKSSISRRDVTSMPTLSIRVAADVKTDLSELGRYAIFVGPPTEQIGVATDPFDYRSYDRGYQRLVPKATDTMQSVVDQMKPGNTAYNESARIVLLPPEGSW